MQPSEKKMADHLTIRRAARGMVGVLHSWLHGVAAPMLYRAYRSPVGSLSHDIHEILRTLILRSAYTVRGRRDS